MPHKILIVIPCYNEAASIAGVIGEIKAMSNIDATACVVNDCSADATAAIAKSSGAVVINLPINLGIGGAVQAGLIYALRNGYDMAVQVDGDGQHPPAEIIKLITCKERTGANVVIGSRFIRGHATFRSTALRRMGIYYFHLLNKFFTGKSIYDSTSGFRLFDRKALEIAANWYPDEYPEPESLVLFSKAGLTVAEVPVQMRERQRGVSSIRHFGSLYYMLKVTIAMFYSYIRYTKKRIWQEYS